MIRRKRAPEVTLAGVPDMAAAVAVPEPRVEHVLLDDLVRGHLTTPFEDWCEATHTHPEAWGAWERFSAESAPAV